MDILINQLQNATAPAPTTVTIQQQVFTTDQERTAFMLQR
jgi:hypothetical protein